MLSGHLKVDIDHVETCAEKIRQCKNELADSTTLIDSYADEIGTPILSDKLHSFATNWKIHREKICEDLGSFADWASGAAKAYDSTEDSLVKALKAGGEEK
jgi:hypothetical protein